MIPPQSTHPSPQRIVSVCVVISILFAGISYLHWTDMSQDLPAFTELQVVEANAMKSNLPSDKDPRHSKRLEFTDGDGLRYQVPSLEAGALAEINQAFRDGTPVRLRYGDWDAALSSNKIFTVYQLEVGNRVLLPYSSRVEVKEREKASRVPVLVISALGAAVAVFIGTRRSFRRGP